MKSIKLASGFAVSALALAIAGQATAQTQSNLSFSGDLKVQTIIDLENSQYSNAQPGLITGDEDWYNFVARWTVSNGPFSGRLRIGINEDNKTGNDGRAHAAQVTVDQLLVTEGPIQFGQVGRLTATAGLYESLTDENDLFDDDESTRFDVDFGLRYTVSDLGLALQLESHRRVEGIFGVSGSLYQDLDVAKFWVDGQYRIPNDGADGMAADNAAYNVGVALQVEPVEQVTLTAVYRLVTDSNRDLTLPTGDPRAVLAAKLDVQATDDVSLFALVTDRDFNDEGGVEDSTVVRGGLTASFAPFIVEAGYEANFAELSEGLIFTSATWTDGPLSAFVALDYNLEGFSGAADNGFELSFGGDYTTASGIVYGAEYTYADDNYFDGADVSEIELFASYSF